MESVLVIKGVDDENFLNVIADDAENIIVIYETGLII